jgi:hypothetical protein
LALLAIARWLDPDPAGHGTHRQLGLPPCTFVKLFGKPCPSCGMTTAWAHLVRGQIARAADVNLGGAILGVTAVLASPWLIVSAARGRWMLARPTELGLVVYAAILAVVAGVDWWMRFSSIE